MKLTAERMRVMFDSLRIGVVALDAKGRVELQNEEASRILGVSEETSLGRRFSRALGAPHPAAAITSTRIVVSTPGSRICGRPSGYSMRTAVVTQSVWYINAGKISSAFGMISLGGMTKSLPRNSKV